MRIGSRTPTAWGSSSTRRILAPAKPFSKESIGITLTNSRGGCQNSLSSPAASSGGSTESIVAGGVPRLRLRGTTRSASVFPSGFGLFHGLDFGVAVAAELVQNALRKLPCLTRLGQHILNMQEFGLPFPHAL